MRALTAFVFIGLSLPTLAHSANYSDFFGAPPPGNDKIKTLLQSLDFKQAPMPVLGAHAMLNASKNFYYLSGADAGKVLTQLWGNPPGSEAGILGMVFPMGSRPEDGEAWASVISYADDGYVSDANAETTDYTALLKDLQQQTADSNPERIKAGYEPITLLGWASPPHYDKATHTIHWARDLIFGNDMMAPHTLNYQLRALGRDGVLELNFVAGLSQLGAIQTAIPQVTGLIAYDSDKTYEDHRDGDKLAAYGPPA